MSDGAERSGAPELPPAWPRLERAAGAAVTALEAWRTRALLAEEEVSRLRTALEQAAVELEAGPESRDQLRRLRAENAALRSRMDQAHRRVGALLAWAEALEEQR